jgi:DNA-directed RNA polymerase subunit RPC12/RpoP
MTMPRRFKCSDCNHEWEVPYGSGQTGREMVCPKCGSSNIHRTDPGGPVRGKGLGGGRRP